MLNYRLKSYYFILMFLTVSASLLGQRKPPKNIVTSANNKAGVFIDVNAAGYTPSTYTPEQLVKNILINGGSTCSVPNVSNVTVTPNQPATDNDRFWGYFHKGTTNFPFTDGIVLTTGYARQAGNVASSVSTAVTGAGQDDPDLLAAVPNPNPNDHYKDNVMLEFDFVPNSSQVKFNYIFASEEYTGSYPCQYSDAFALLIKPTAGGPYVNVAVLPGGAGPVSMTNIHPAISGVCPAINETYFAGYNSASNIVTNYEGRTIPLTATATVTPGVSYHFKMVLSDYRDTAFDSAVFIEGGSFDIGIQLVDGTGAVLPSTLNMCDNTPQTLVAQVSNVTGLTYQWYLNGVAINGATSGTYVATAPGVYQVQVQVPGNTCPASATVTIVGGTSPVVQNATLTACYATGNATFNLTQAEPYLTTTTGVTFKYYLNQADAVAGNNSNITTPTNFSSAGGQTIYVNVAKGFCSKVAQLQLVKAPQMTASIATPQKITCAVPQITLNAGASVYPSGATFNWVASGGGNIVSGATTSSPVVNKGGTYTLTITKVYQPGATCTATTSVTVAEDLVKPVVALTAPRYKICQGESVVLTATGALTYVWSGLSGNGNVKTVTPNTTTTYTVNGIAANGCQSATPATITIEVVPAIVSNVKGGYICQGDKITLDAGAGPNYTYLWNTGATTQTISVGTPGAYAVTINNGDVQKCLRYR
uniref:Choice-of-anchor L domain-containing protein n=1 Tax=Chryseobacterium endophyticum TaxID=1854762 RepID=A0AAU6WVT3_9FLAO